MFLQDPISHLLMRMFTHAAQCHQFVQQRSADTRAVQRVRAGALVRVQHVLLEALGLIIVIIIMRTRMHMLARMVQRTSFFVRLISDSKILLVYTNLDCSREHKHLHILVKTPSRQRRAGKDGDMARAGVAFRIPVERRAPAELHAPKLEGGRVCGIGQSHTSREMSHAPRAFELCPSTGRGVAARQLHATAAIAAPILFACRCRHCRVRLGHASLQQAVFLWRQMKRKTSCRSLATLVARLPRNFGQQRPSTQTR